ncbi:antibiotic biosynthesis monooxygenase [Psychrosphaera sp. 1_MG-2023]|uniref:putative quinol monooxygenase n=1 Tax=unclassified Psychrosphaera TaxID=2641570 RepID=UPI002091227F|nr:MULTISPECIES: antibiotic biosynthesis monooxygenase [unclassified Psychrosphaera]MDO6718953.1 antibiotic biosynthesis monooxygenase [Psychrosphaera sp. 1_MG-2023]
MAFSSDDEMLKKVILQGYIIIPDADLKEVNSELDLHIKLTLGEPGCLIFEVIHDQQNPNKLHVYEEFVDEHAFEYHQNRVKSSKWGKVTTRVERHYKITH